MAKKKTKGYIQKKYIQLEDERKAVWELIESLQTGQLHYSSTPEAWSPMQVIDHVVRSEVGTVQYMQKKMSDLGNVKKTGLKNRLRNIVLVVALKLPLKFKAPDVPSIQPSDKPDREKVLQNWVKARQELYAIIDQQPLEALEKEIFRHPIAGKFNMLQSLRFMEEHLKHHRKQLLEIVSREEFPTT